MNLRAAAIVGLAATVVAFGTETIAFPHGGGSGFRDPPPRAPPAADPAPPLHPEPGDRPRTLAPPADAAGDWTTWWARIEDEVLDVKAAVLGFRIDTGSSYGSWGRPLDPESMESLARRPIDQVTRNAVVPALLRWLDAGDVVHPDLRAAAWIALAKVTDDPTHLDRLVEALAAAPGGEAVEPAVREAVALALGLLRRDAERRRFDASDLDRVREACFAACEVEALPRRARARALLAIGLLGDQPTRRGDAGRRLIDLLRRRLGWWDLRGACIHAIAMQDPATLPPEAAEVLKERPRLPPARDLEHLAWTTHAGVEALGQGLALDARAGREGAFGVGGRADALLVLARAAARRRRGFAAVSVGLVLRAAGTPPLPGPITDWRERALATLRKGLLDLGLPPRERAAFALALGLSRDVDSRPLLLQFASDRAVGADLRGTAALALGIVFPLPVGGRAAMVAALRDAASEGMRIQVATGLALAGLRPPVPMLLEAFGRADTQVARAEILRALARVGDARAIPSVLAVAEDASLPVATRARAVEALGEICDPCRVPSLAILRRDMDPALEAR